MREAWLGAGAGAVGVALGWALHPTEHPTDRLPVGSSTPRAAPTQRTARPPCPPAPPADGLGALRQRRKALEMANRLLEGKRDLNFGPPMAQPPSGYDTATVRADLERTLTLGTLHFSTCDAYPCTGVWDVSGEDPDAADTQLDALRALYPDATTSWWEDGGPFTGEPVGQVPFIIHGPIDHDVFISAHHTAEVGRVRWLSRALKAETIRRLGGREFLVWGNADYSPDNPQGHVPRPRADP